jgi:tetratricopeptide (TPR) repeat protein
MYKGHMMFVWMGGEAGMDLDSVGVLSRLEELVLGGGEVHEGDLLFVKEVLENPDLPYSRVEGLFLRHRRVGENLLRRMSEVYPEDLNASTLLIRVLGADGRYPEAEEQFKRTTGRHPEDAWLYTRYASFLRDLGRRDEAEACYQRALKLDSSDPFYRIEYAKFLEEGGKVGKAKKFYKQALKLLPPGDRLKDWLTLRLRDVVGQMMWSILYEPPSAGSLSRFTRHHPEEIFEMLSMESGKARMPPQESSFVRRAKETGMYGKTILEVEDAKERTVVEDPDDWAHVEKLNILNLWKPGFELNVNQIFFSSKCPECRLDGRKERRCREGLHNCAFEEEYDQFEREYVREVVKRLKEGAEPGEIPQLHVPEPLKEIAQRVNSNGEPLLDRS